MPQNLFFAPKFLLPQTAAGYVPGDCHHQMPENIANTIEAISTRGRHAALFCIKPSKLLRLTKRLFHDAV